MNAILKELVNYKWKNYKEFMKEMNEGTSYCKMDTIYKIMEGKQSVPVWMLRRLYNIFGITDDLVWDLAIDLRKIRDNTLPWDSGK
jgi:hypothetical protein